MRRIPSVFFALTLLGAGGSIPAAQAAAFNIEGKYELVQPPQPTETPGKIEVVDVFWYGCPHCFHVLPFVERFEQSMPDDVAMRHLPAVFRKSWEIGARAYYTAKLLGVDKQIHVPIFNAIHKNGQRLGTKEKLRDFFAKFGVSKSDFDKAYDSFSVNASIRKSVVMQRRYGVRGTPTFIVAGKYRVSPSTAGGYENSLKVVQALVDKQRKTNLATQ